jgi:hypothetical protein
VRHCASGSLPLAHNAARHLPLEETVASLRRKRWPVNCDWGMGGRKVVWACGEGRVRTSLNESCGISLAVNGL